MTTSVFDPFGWPGGGIAVHHVEVPGAQSFVGNSVYSAERLPTEPIGTYTATFAGMPANGEIRVYYPDGTEAAGVELSSVDQQLTWNKYSSGNPNNIVTIRIVHLQYKIKEFLFTTPSGQSSGSIPIQLDKDPWYKNPA